MSLYQKYNNENILIRAVLAGLLDILNNRIEYTQIWGDEPEDTEIIKVPWFYNQSGDERFNQDFYTHYAHCMPPRPVDGNFDMVPRGVITYTGSSINAQRITSRYVQGRYVKEIDGQLQSYVSFLYSIPLNVRVDCEMWIDRHITALKIEQEIREVFYKTLTYYTYYKGLRVGSTVGFPEDVTIEKNISYSFEPKNRIKINFALEIETYQPVFDKTTEVRATSRIKRLGYNLYPVNEKDTPNVVKDVNVSPKNEDIVITSPNSEAIIPKGIPIWIEWIANSRGKIIDKVNIWWSTEEDDFNEIELMVPNNEFYIWNIPADFTNYEEPDIIWEEDNNISISRNPVLKIIPDLSTGEITESSFSVFDEGYFITELEDTSINIQLEMKDDNGVISYTPDGAIWANVKYNVLDTINPVSIDPSVNIMFPGIIDYKQININVNSSNEREIIGTSYNIKII